MNNHDKIHAYLERYARNQLDQHEWQELFVYLTAVEDDELGQILHEVLDEEDNLSREQMSYVDLRVKELHANILKKIDHERSTATVTLPRVPIYRNPRYLAIAASFVVLFVGLFYLRSRLDPASSAQDSVVAKDTLDVLPGGHKALLIVDGQKFRLDSSVEGLFFRDDRITNAKEQLIAELDSKKDIRIMTPYGGQYRLTLADSSVLYLNAGTEIHFTTTFGKTDRTIDLVGEAYFEVSQNEKLPFVVQTAWQSNTVLGTVFNVQAYADEHDVVTTLKSGRVEVHVADQTIALGPDQQAVLQKHSDSFRRQNVDADGVLAWKDGVFDLHGMSLQECMRVISRWYDLEVIYAGAVPDIILGGKMSRGVRLSTFLEFLEHNFGLKAEIQSDKKLIINTITNNKSNRL